jgi:rhamnosyl/mannosyltransferase
MNGVRLLKAGRLATVASTPLGFALPWLLSRQRPDIAHLHFPYPLGELAQLLLGRSRRLVITYHSDVVKQQGLLRWYRPLLWRILRRADRILATSPRYIESSPYLSALRDKCAVVPLGVEIGRFQQIDAERVAGLRRRFPGPLLLCVGRLRYYKGLDYLIAGMPDLPATLLIVGDGPMRAAWQAQAQQLGVADRVHFLTDVDDADLPAYYAAGDLFVLPASQRSEAFGTVLLEAMACGRPVISTELGTGTSWVNQDGVTGLVTPARDTAALVGAIRRLLDAPALREELGAAGRARVAAEFTFGRMLERIEAVYREIGV